MTNGQYIVSNTDRSDANAFTVPGDEDGGSGDSSYQVEPETQWQRQHLYVHINNGWDVNVDVTLQGSHTFDESMSNPADDGSAETINSGGNVGLFDTEVGHSYAQINVDPAGTPTSGELTITFQNRDD